jgi:tetratricopeptide (TPR) repeat protein
MKQNKHALSLWSELASSQGIEKAYLLAHLYNASGGSNSDEATPIGIEAIEALLESADYEEAFDIGFDVSWQLSATRSYCESRSIVERLLPYEHLVDSHSAGLVRWNYAASFARAEDYFIALHEFQHAFETFSEEHLFPRACIAEAQGECLSELSRHDEAVTRLTTAVSLFEDEGFVEGVASAKRKVAMSMLALGKSLMAVRYGDDALNLAHFLGHQSDAQHCQVILGRAYTALGEHDAAASQFEKASQDRSEDQSRKIAAEAMFYNAVLLKVSGRGDEARREFARLVPILGAVSLPALADKALQEGSNGEGAE